MTGRVWRTSLAVVNAVWQDGFIHAGNLAYVSIVSLFPFFIVTAAVFSAFGGEKERAASVGAVLVALPPAAAQALAPVAGDVILARNGPPLWIGAVVALWTVSGMIETIRDILRRAYGAAPESRLWWRYRLGAGGVCLLAAILVLIALYAQVAITAALTFVLSSVGGLLGKGAGVAVLLFLSQIVPLVVLYGAIYLLFVALTPAEFSGRGAPRWPGALLVAAWWGLVLAVLPLLLRSVLHYNATYGSLAGIMITLFFFWLVGLGLVAGAELNAILARRGAQERAVDERSEG